MRALRFVWITVLVVTGVVLPANHAVLRADTLPLPERADEIVDYRISVTLDADKKQLQGHERVTWRNPSSSEDVSDLWFHLYLNAFQNTQSTFMRESGGQLRGDVIPTDGWGWTQINSLKRADGVNLLPSWHFHAPDDGNKDDRTVGSVQLPEPVKPGETITLDITFTAQLPKVFARTGYHDDYFLVGQWFPKLGVYEPAGMRGRATSGWNCHQFHANSEFYADFGHYRVEMTLPTRFVVGATGERKDRKDNGNGTATYVYEQSNVHDFAWTASPHFVEVKRRFDPSREVTAEEYARAARLLNRTLDQVRLRDVDITFLMQPSHMPQIDRHVRAAMLSLKSFGLRYGYYPHRTLTIVDPAFGAGGSGGMEYPTFITTETQTIFSWPLFKQINVPEEVLVHEFGHQYFQGMLGSNEFEEAWLDEGINSYATRLVMEEGYGADANLVDFLGLHINERDLARIEYTPSAIFNAIRQPSWTYETDRAYEFNSYMRTELMLANLEGLVGHETMARIMRTYAERFRFKHPWTDDYLAVVNEVAGRDLRPALLQFLDRGQIIDYEIASVTSEPSRPATGYLDTKNGRTLVTAEKAQSDADRAASDGKRTFDTTVIVQRRGDAVWPIDIAFKFVGKPVERATWDDQRRWRRFDFHRPEQLEWVDIDPDRKVELDVDWLNNAQRLQPDRRAAARLTSRWLLVVQQLLATVGM
jgi:hypothetical protein